MVIWCNLVPDLAHDAILINQERLAVDAHKRSTSIGPLFPDAIELRNRRIGIGKQRERQVVLVGEFLMGRHIISAYAQHDDTLLLHNAVRIAESASLLGAAGSVVFARKDTCKNHVFTCKFRLAAIPGFGGESPYL
jgi:hypothetical protein